MTQKKGLLPSCWGSSYWFVLHSMAYVYDPKDKNKYFNFFMNLGYILPCSECKIHYQDNVSRDDLEKALESNESLFRWVYDLHNKVNQQLNVPKSKWPSYESVKQKYQSYESDCSSLKGVCGLKVGSKPKKVKIVEEFGSEKLNDQMIVIIVLCVLLTLSILNQYIPLKKIIKNLFGFK
jgi:hypothetical protein